MRRVTWKDVVALIAAALVTFAAYRWFEAKAYPPDDAVTVSQE